MVIPSSIKILHNELPDAPGVYFYYDISGRLLYIGKATSLKRRVGSYFTKAHNSRIADLVANIVRIDYVQTPTVIEALVLESNQIRTNQPPYNILSRDDKSFLYLCITNEDFPNQYFSAASTLNALASNHFQNCFHPSRRKSFSPSLVRTSVADRYEPLLNSSANRFRGVCVESCYLVRVLILKSADVLAFARVRSRKQNIAKSFVSLSSSSMERKPSS